MQTRTATATLTYARHIASKLAADLKRLQRLYKRNRPTDTEISDYLEEAALLLNEGYLGTVIYGLKRNDKWVIALKYQTIGNQLVGSGDDPGISYQPTDLSGTDFGSFLTYSQKWNNLPESQKTEFKEKLPVERVPGSESGIENGYWVKDKEYHSGHLGVQRSLIRKR